MEQKIIGKIEHVARTCRKTGFQFHADLLTTAIERDDVSMVHRVANLLQRANRKALADLLTNAVGVPGWDKVEV